LDGAGVRRATALVERAGGRAAAVREARRHLAAAEALLAGLPLAPGPAAELRTVLSALADRAICDLRVLGPASAAVPTLSVSPARTPVPSAPEPGACDIGHMRALIGPAGQPPDSPAHLSGREPTAPAVRNGTAP
jgi:hypothetical protein